MNSVDDFVFYDVVQYTKNDWRNRNKIKTAQGVQWLTVPVTVTNRMNSTIDEICTANTDWQEKHWKSISQNYGKCANFSGFSSRFQEFYENNRSTNLSEINRSLVKILCECLDVNPQFHDARNLNIEGDRNERLVSICKQLGATEYLSGPAAQAYLDEKLFEDAGIKVRWMNFSHYEEYPQRFPPFEHKVSAIDLIFNEGANGKNFLLSNKTTADDTTNGGKSAEKQPV